MNRWTEYCTELYNHKASGDPSVLDCPQTDTEDDHPVLHKEVEAALQSLKKGKLAGIDNIPAELVQAGEEDVITTLTTICNKIWQTDWRMANPIDPVLSHHTSQERQGEFFTTYYKPISVLTDPILTTSELYCQASSSRHTTNPSQC